MARNKSSDLKGDTIVFLNQKLSEIREIGIQKLKILRCVKVLKDCGICEENLLPIRSHIETLTIEQNHLVTRSLCDNGGKSND